MRKLLLIIFTMLLTSSVASSQFKFGQQERFRVAAFVDPTASLKEKSPCFGAELELEAHFIYIKASMQLLPGLEGGYTDAAGGMGLNFTNGIFEDTRVYAGIRLGHIWRKDQGYPLFGWEGGINFNIGPSKTTYIGVSGTLDWREDFLFTGAEPEYQPSGYVKIGTSF